MNVKSTLIEAAELAALPSSQVLVVDCRFDLADAELGARAYREGHLPGALYASLDRDLSDLARIAQGLGRHPLPLEADFGRTLGRWGWKPGVQVVAYDAGSGALAAARLWWLLKLAGVHAVAVLDGGHAAWVGAGLPLETATPVPVPGEVSLRYDARQLVLDTAELHDASHPLLLDARAVPRYRGEVEPLDRAAGHVPGARNRPFADNLDAAGRFKPAGRLHAEFSALLGDVPPERVVHMCGSGVTACHNLLAMEHAGLAGSRLYAPSWSGWVSDSTRPVAKG